MSRKNDPTLCWECQRKPVEYKTSVTGATLKHGICRDCYERRASRVGRGSGFSSKRRSGDAAENVRETKYGIDR